MHYGGGVGGNRAGNGIRNEGCKYKGPSGKAFLRRGHLSRDLKAVRAESCRNLGEGHFRLREAPVQRPCGETVLGAFEGVRGGHVALAE